MGVDLRCPNCGGTIGYADSDDGYVEKYLKSDKNGQPECPNCGAGDSMINFERNLFIGAVVFIVIIVIFLPIYLTV